MCRRRASAAASSLFGGGYHGRSTTNIILREALEQSSRDVGAGQDIGRALKRTAVFPPMAVQIFSVGRNRAGWKRCSNGWRRTTIGKSRGVPSV